MGHAKLPLSVSGTSWGKEDYKIMRGMDRVDSQKLFPMVEESITRGGGAQV